MTASSPTPHRRLIAVGSAITAAGALTLAGALPALAASAFSPIGADPAGAHYAAARIAAVEWCVQGVIGDVDTDRAGGDDTADWSRDADRIGAAPHFRIPPGTAHSAVTRAEDGLTAVAAVTDLRFTPDCGPFAVPDDSGGEHVPTAFQDTDTVAVGYAEASASWSQEEGARARIAVEGLEILGEPVDLGEGPYRDGFTEEGDDGDSVRVEVTAERYVTEVDEGVPHGSGPGAAAAPGTANAWLAIRFDVAWLDRDGEPTDTVAYRLDLAQAGVHSAAPPTGPADGGATRGGGSHTPAGEDAGSTGGGGATGASEPPVFSGNPTPEPDPQPAPPPPGRGADVSPAPETPRGPEPSPRPRSPSSASASAPPQVTGAPPSPRPSPTVAQPVLPAPTPPVSDSGGSDRLPITGSALFGLVGSGLVALGGGSAAIYLGRARKAGIDGDDV
ncbi:hypothetical protein HNR23_002869 [Nocardiopsis mwathae]|uniref:Uncharacterized protein n=1 Tax=Nocardiopsis mwathae TaxID=1472723 RepID=A0A7W9YII3_9ACTN|nr:hypothetical protein [Nocardiopsis mwathae]MBB6172809.1 hypothetical protein [Nocardiopsis mwathae]